MTKVITTAAQVMFLSRILFELISISNPILLGSVYIASVGGVHR